VPGVTFEQAFQTQEVGFLKWVIFEGGQGVVRTGGLKATASWQKRPERILIHLDADYCAVVAEFQA